MMKFDTKEKQVQAAWDEATLQFDEDRKINKITLENFKAKRIKWGNRSIWEKITHFFEWQNDIHNDFEKSFYASHEREFRDWRRVRFATAVEEIYGNTVVVQWIGNKYTLTPVYSYE